MAPEAVGGIIKPFILMVIHAKKNWRHLQGNRVSEAKKTCFACRKEEIGQAHP
jgi:hypothetical protein